MNKVQRNVENENILVQSDNSSNIHYYHENFNVSIEKVLSNEDVKRIFLLEVTSKELNEIAKNWISTKEGYATSNVEDKVLNIKQGSIVKFKRD